MLAIRQYLGLQSAYGEIIEIEDRLYNPTATVRARDGSVSTHKLPNLSPSVYKRRRPVPYLPNIARLPELGQTWGDPEVFTPFKDAIIAASPNLWDNLCQWFQRCTRDRGYIIEVPEGPQLEAEFDFRKTHPLNPPSGQKSCRTNPHNKKRTPWVQPSGQEVPHALSGPVPNPLQWLPTHRHRRLPHVCNPHRG